MGLHIDEIISQLLDLAKKHKATGDNIDDFIDSELIELEAEHIIIDYCELVVVYCCCCCWCEGYWRGTSA